MEDILDRSQRPHHPQRPLMGMDEQLGRLIQEPSRPLPAQLGNPERVDDEDECTGTAARFLFPAPLAGWRRVSVRAHRTAVDWVEDVRIVLEADFPQAENIIVGCDHVNPHTIGA